MALTSWSFSDKKMRKFSLGPQKCAYDNDMVEWRSCTVVIIIDIQ